MSVYERPLGDQTAVSRARGLAAVIAGALVVTTVAVVAAFWPVAGTASLTAPAAPAADVRTQPQPTIAFPELPLYAGRADGTVVRIGASGIGGKAIAVCPGKIVSLLAGSPRGALLVAVCGPTAAGAGPAYVIDPATGSVSDAGVTAFPRNDAAAWSPDGTRLALLSPGTCDAAGCGTRVTVRDGGIREILPSTLSVSDLRWTDAGPTIYRTAAKDVPAGTYRWTGAAWEWLSADRLVDAKGSVLLLRRTFQGSVQERYAVVQHSASGETVLTPPNASEWPLAILDDGSIAAWRFASPGPAGAIVRYDQSGRGRVTSGEFTPTAVPSGGWLVGNDFQGQIRAYSLERDAFAAWPGQSDASIQATAVLRQ